MYDAHQYKELVFLNVYFHLLEMTPEVTTAYSSVDLSWNHSVSSYPHYPTSVQYTFPILFIYAFHTANSSSV